MWKIWLILMLAVCANGLSCAPRTGAARDTVLTIKGSDTMVYLVSAWAEAYMDRHPETEISVTGGGSGTGFAALLNRTTDMCAASRGLMPNEQERARRSGIHPVGHLVARDGIAVIVHPSNRIKALTLDEVRKIFVGEYDNWNELGGADRKIVVFSRDTSSGTYIYFQDHVLRRDDFRRDARLLPATSAIVQSVTKDEGAIGYVGLGYALEAGTSVRCLAIGKAGEGQPVVPSLDSVRNGHYAIVRPLRLFTSGRPVGLAASFLDFCLGETGQEIVNQSGYVAAE